MRETSAVGLSLTESSSLPLARCLTSFRNMTLLPLRPLCLDVVVPPFESDTLSSYCLLHLTSLIMLGFASQTDPRRLPRHLPPDLPPSPRSNPLPHIQLRLHPFRTDMGILNLARISRHLTPVVHASTDGRGGDHNDPLSRCDGFVSGFVYSQLDVQVSGSTIFQAAAGRRE